MFLTRLIGRNIRQIHVTSTAMTSHRVLRKDGLFYVELEKGNAVLEYELKDDVIDMYHTEVPDAYRGQGIAKILVKDALQYAVANNLTVKPTCWYVKKYVTENPNSNLQVADNKL